MERIANADVCAACAAQAQKYAALRKPYLINDMAMQDVLLDRRRVYQKLQARRGATKFVIRRCKGERRMTFST